MIGITDNNLRHYISMILSPNENMSFFETAYINLLYYPFPECRIMQFRYSNFFIDNPSMPDTSKLKSDRISDYDSPNSFVLRELYWIALKSTDNWHVIIQKTHDLLKMVDCCHFMLEGFTVMEDILIPEFGH